MLQTVFKKLFSLREQAARRPGADDGFDPQEKPFLDHLDDLRVTLFRIITTLAISSAVCFIFNKQIFQFVQLPAKSPIAEISPGITLWEKLDFFMLGPTELIFLMFKLAFYCGVIITFPFTVFFLFQFLMPGLRQSEKRTIIPGVGIGFILFLVGGAFAFFVATPLALKYFYKFENERLAATDPASIALSRPVSEVALIGVDGEIIPPFVKEEAAAEPTPEAGTETGTEAKPESALTPQLQSELRDYLKKTLATAEGANFVLRYDEDREKLVLVTSKGGKSSYQIGKYISFISQLVLVFGISFQMPIVVTILVKLDLLTALVMRNTRSYAWVIIVVVAAVLTPSPDAFTMGLLAVPLILLYEICIVIATIIERTRSRKERAEAEAEKTRLEKLYLKPAAELSEEEKAELHRAEIEQYEREHAHLYQEENEHVARDSFHGDDPTNHDESWHADDHYWHDDGHHHHDDPHHGSESDHAEPEDLTPGDPTESGRETRHEYENCAPEGPIVDLNHATLEELQTLPGIGPKMAQTIIENRRYETFDDLERIPGLGPEKIRRITERIMLG